jgi:hypothetical protein
MILDALLVPLLERLEDRAQAFVGFGNNNLSVFQRRGLARFAEQAANRSRQEIYFATQGWPVHHICDSLLLVRA